MIELTGKYNTAKVFTDNVEQEAIAQIITLLNQEFAKDSTVRIMPDTHAGAGCTIGTTMTIHGKAVPYMAGVDIGCGMETVLLRDKHVELEKLPISQVNKTLAWLDSQLLEDSYTIWPSHRNMPASTDAVWQEKS